MSAEERSHGTVCCADPAAAELLSPDVEEIAERVGVEELTDIVAAAAGDESLRERTWVLLTEPPEGGSGIAGYANTNGDIADVARAALASR